MPDLGYTTAGAGASIINAAWMQPLTMPEDGELESVSVHIHLDAGGARVAVYTGGTSNDNPEGATLVADAGLVGEGAVLHTLPCTGSLTSGSRIWLAIKSNDSTRVKNDANVVGDFAGDALSTTGEAADETGAWSASIANGTVTQRTVTLTWYLTYTTGDEPAPDASTSGMVRSIGWTSIA